MEKKLGAVVKRTKPQRLEDLNLVMPLFLKGKSFSEIATIMKPGRDYRVTYESVYADIQFVLKQWRKERTAMIDHQMDVDLKKIDHLEAVYWSSWEKSCQNKVKTVQKEKSIFDKKKQKTAEDFTNRQSEKHVTEFVGDKQWLDGVQWCIQQRAALLQYKKAAPPGSEEGGNIHEVRDVIFVTRTRRNNDQFTEAIEVGESGEDLQKLIQS